MEATKKAAPVKIMWSDDMYDAFLYLCHALSDCCMLLIPVSCDKFHLQTDTSGRGIGAILSVIQDGEELPVSFFSKNLKPAETCYSATELGCLAITRAVEHFAVYLTGRSFTVQMDHRAHQFLQQSRHPNGRLTRWALTLQQYMFDIQYHPGKNNGNADGLSCQAWSWMSNFSKRGEMSGLRPDSCMSKELNKHICVCVCYGCKNIIFFIL